MTYKSKADLRQTIEDLKARVKYHEGRADSWSTQYWERDADYDEALTNLKDAHQAELERVRDEAIRALTLENDRYRELAVAVFTFYGVNAQELMAALETQQQQDDQKLLKDNLKKVKNANKTEEAK